jgi:predicted ABC-type ATPase
LRKCKLKGYTINLIYFWLQSPELAVYRVRRRVETGGHNIPEDVIRRRYERGRKNLL